jgi:hypothetical protein
MEDVEAHDAVSNQSLHCMCFLKPKVKHQNRHDIYSMSLGDEEDCITNYPPYPEPQPYTISKTPAIPAYGGTKKSRHPHYVPACLPKTLVQNQNHLIREDMFGADSKANDLYYMCFSEPKLDLVHDFQKAKAMYECWNRKGTSLDTMSV